MADSFGKAVDEVLAEIDRHESGPIERGSPLHSAVVRLEARSRWLRVFGFQQNKLFAPASRFWFHWLWCSRGIANPDFYRVREAAKHPAEWHREMLRRELERQRDDVGYRCELQAKFRAYVWRRLGKDG